MLKSTKFESKISTVVFWLSCCAFYRDAVVYFPNASLFLVWMNSILRRLKLDFWQGACVFHLFPSGLGRSLSKERCYARLLQGN